MTKKTQTVLSSARANEIIGLWTQELQDICDLKVFCEDMPSGRNGVFLTNYTAPNGMVTNIFCYAYYSTPVSYHLIGQLFPCLGISEVGNIKPFLILVTEEGLVSYLKKKTKILLDFCDRYDK